MLLQLQYMFGSGANVELVKGDGTSDFPKARCCFNSGLGGLAAMVTIMKYSEVLLDVQLLWAKSILSLTIIAIILAAPS